MSSETKPPASGTPGRVRTTSVRRWRVGVVGACLVAGFAVGAVVASASQGAPAPLRRSRPAVVAASVPTPVTAGGGGAVSLVDSFDRPDDPSALGVVPGGSPWQAVIGTWGVANQQAYLSAPPGASGVAVVTASGTVSTAQVRVADVVAGAGLVFAYRDRSDYWVIEAEPSYGTWNVVHVTGGGAHGMGNVGLAPTAAGTVVSAVTIGATVALAVDGDTVRTLDDPSLGASSAAGMAVNGSGATKARFEDFQLTSVGA